MAKPQKIISLVLSLIIALSIFAIVPFTANAAEAEITETGAESGTTGDCTWTLDNGVLTISGNGKMENYFSYDEKPWETEIKKVVIENGVRSIGDSAFYGCTELTSVSIPDSVTSIGDFAFQNTSLKSVTIPASVTKIGDYAIGYVMGLTPQGSGYLPIRGFTIYGYEGSTAEKYAKDNNINFVKLTDKKDAASGVIITVPDDIKLSVIDITNKMPAGTIKAYVISLLKDGKTVQPENIVTVKIPCANKNAKAYRLESDGKMTDMKSKYKDGYIVFTTDHFSVYVLV